MGRHTLSAADSAAIDHEHAAQKELDAIGDRLFRRVKDEPLLRNLTCGQFHSPEVGGWLEDDSLTTDFRLCNGNFSPGKLECEVDFTKKRAMICRIQVSFWKSAPPPKPLSDLIKMDSVDMMNVERFMATVEGELRCKVVKLSTSYMVVSFWLEFDPDRFKTQAA